MTDFGRVLADSAPPLLAALLLVVAVLVVMVLRLQGRLNRMLLQYQRLIRGGTAGNLDELLERQLDQLEATSTRVEAIESDVESLRASQARAVQRVGLVRFNPFADTGGDQSFSIALLDGSGDGIVISSLFSRSETRVFAKPVQNGASKYALTDEERQAIQLAGDSGEPEAARTR